MPATHDPGRQRVVGGHGDRPSAVGRDQPRLDCSAMSVPRRLLGPKAESEHQTSRGFERQRIVGATPRRSATPGLKLCTSTS